VLCVAAHPDDEVLGCGATLARLSDMGCDVHVLVMGEGIGARYDANKRPNEQVGELADDMLDAARILGATPHQFTLPDQRFETIPVLEVVKLIESVKAEVQPDLVFTHHPGDLNTDHRVVANAVLTAFRPLPDENTVTILAFETLSSTEWNVTANSVPFVPNWYEDALPGLERKLQAMAAYSGELREFPHPRSLSGIETLAQLRGMTVGIQYAEAFMLLRHLGSLSE